MEKDHANCYRNPCWLLVAIVLFIMGLCVYLLAFFGMAFWMAFETAHMFMLKDDDSLRVKVNKAIDKWKFTRFAEEKDD